MGASSTIVKLNRLDLKAKYKCDSYFLDDVDATDMDHEEYVREPIMKHGSRCFFCSSEGNFTSGCTQLWDAVTDAKHPHT